MPTAWAQKGIGEGKSPKELTSLWKVPLRIQVRFLMVKKSRECFRIAPHFPCMNTAQDHNLFPQFSSWAAHFCPFLVPLSASF